MVIPWGSAPYHWYIQAGARGPSGNGATQSEKMERHQWFLSCPPRVDLQALSWIFWLWRPGGAYALMASRVVLKQPDMYWLLRASGPLPLKLPFDPGRLGQWDRQSWVRTQLGYLLPCDREQVA